MATFNDLVNLLNQCAALVNTNAPNENPGNDTLTWVAGSDDFLNAGAGNDVVDIYGSSSDQVYAYCGSGNDTVNVQSGYMNIVDGAGGDDVLNINGGNYATLLYGNEGNDLLVANGGQYNLMAGGSGNDTLRGARNSRECYFYGEGDGNDVILNYGTEDDIAFYNGSISSFGVSGDDVYIFSGFGSLKVQDCRGEVVSVTLDDFETTVGYIYMADGAGGVDGRGISEFEVIVGHERYANHLIAGEGGSNLWGGGSGSDTLQGGSGADLFYYGGGDGQDYILNGSSADAVWFYSAFSIDSIYMSGNDLVIQSSGSNSLTVKNWSENGMNKFRLWDGSTYQLHQGGGSSVTYARVGDSSGIFA